MLTDALGAPALDALGRGDPVAAHRAAVDLGLLGVAVRLVLATDPIPRDEAETLLGEHLLEQLHMSRLLQDLDMCDGVRLAVDLTPVEVPDAQGSARDVLVASDLGHGRGRARVPARADHVVGVGAAALTLLAATPRDRVVTAVDVGTGGGVHALALASHAERVVVTDVSPRALAFCRLSHALSGVAQPDARLGDLLDPLADGEADLVVANPPFVVGDGSVDAVYRDGGRSGDGLSAELLGGLRRVLRPGGHAVALASWLHVRGGPAWEDRVSGWLPRGCDAVAVQRDVLDPVEHASTWLDETAPLTADPDDERARDEATVRWLDALEGLGAAGVGQGVVALRRTGRDGGRHALLDTAAAGSSPDAAALVGALDGLDASARLHVHGADGTCGTVLRRADDVVLHRRDRLPPAADGPGATWRTDTLWLSREDAPAWPALEVDEPVAALVAACDGTAPLDLVLDLLEAAHDVPRADALAAVDQLLLRGVLSP